MCSNSNNTLRSLVQCLVDDFFLLRLFPLMIGVAIIVFLWGVFKFIRDAGDEKARTEGKKLIFWGLFGLFVMLCVWAFVEILAGTFFRGNGIFIPQIRV